MKNINEKEFSEYKGESLNFQFEMRYLDNQYSALFMFNLSLC